MAEEIAITYETLFELLRREKNREELQKLSDTFVEDVKRYLQEKSQASKKLGMFQEQENAHKQLGNIKKILKELYERREKKIILLALNKSRTRSNIIDTSSLLPWEEQFYNDLVSVLDISRKQNLLALLQREISAIIPQAQEPEPAPPATQDPKLEEKASEQGTEEEKGDEQGAMPRAEQASVDTSSADASRMPELMSIKFLRAVPSFVGQDLQSLGPYEEGEVADLPKAIADVLIARERAQLVKS
ncbi:MAG: hypothetical protein KJ709_09510 [Nanoarchaeota archaeon]|nr:hypothetical protein [Nanoarchaeota archaeon]